MHDKTNADHEMSLIVKTVAGWITGFILLFGVHVVLYGHETPGGGFAGGVIIASSFVLLRLAFGQHVAIRTVGQRSIPILASAGATNLLLVTFLIPVSALLLGILVLGEQPQWTAFAGMALIFAGLAAVDGRLPARLRRQRAQAEAARRSVQ